MDQEEYSGGSGGGGGGCRPKKSKQKKAPQRGLGVAQLEKIISEEKQKKGYFGNNIDSDTRAGPFLALHNHPDHFRPNIENSGLSKSWNGEYNNIHNNNNNLAYEQSNGPILAHQFQRHSSSSPLVKYSSAVMSTQMEPPSIPIVHFKNYYALTEEDKMIGMMKKRAYPFSLDPIISSSKSDEFASFTNHQQQQYTFHMPQPSNKLIRENVSNPAGPIRNLNEERVDIEKLNGKFLTLAPPEVASPPLKPVNNDALDYLGRTRHELISDHQCIPGQDEYGNKSEIERAGPSLSFFPVKELHTKRDSAYVIGSGDGETIDLNLKL